MLQATRRGEHNEMDMGEMKRMGSGGGAPVARVKFNVGGRHFEASRALIDEHSDTMLARLVSETWNDDTSNPVFIDRNGDIFPYVLDYLRYGGSIELPITISGSMFDRELDYYGIATNDSIITQEAKWGSLTKAMKSVTASLAKAQMRHDMLFLALECNNQFCQRLAVNGADADNIVQVRIYSDHKLYDKRKVILEGEERKMFTDYLERYFGLGVHAGNPNRFGGIFEVGPKDAIKASTDSDGADGSRKKKRKNPFISQNDYDSDEFVGNVPVPDYQPKIGPAGRRERA